MDLMQNLFPSLRLKQAVYTRVEATSPWGFDFIPYRHTKFGIVTEGRCYIDLKSGEMPLLLERGSCYLLPRGDAFRLRETPESATIDFEDALPYLDGRLLRYGGGGLQTTVTGGRFIFANDSYPVILDLLPPLIHFKVSEQELTALEATIQLLANETITPSAGSAMMVDRLADIFFIQSLRAYLLSGEGRHAGWLGLVADEKLCTALRLIHARMAHPWTIAELAVEAGMSRAVFAARFKEKLGLSPIAYLTRHRLDEARRLLQQTPLSLAQIATQVGYSSEAAFHKAFRREVGMAPGEFRQQGVVAEHA